MTSPEECDQPLHTITGDGQNTRKTGAASSSMKDGSRAWFVCFSGWVIQVIHVGILHAFGVFFIEFLNEFKVSKAEAAWIGSGAYGISMLFGPITSMLQNRFGNRVVSAVGSVLCATSMLATSFAKTPTVMYVTFSLVYGIGTSLAYTPTMCIAGDYFEKYFVLATGIITSGSSCGTLVIAPVSQALMDAIGWRKTWRILAAISLIPMLSGIAFKPLDGAGKTKSEIIKTSVARKLMKDIPLWKNRVFIVWICGIMFTMFGYYIPYVHLPSYARDCGLSADKASSLMMFLGGSTAFGRIFFGKVLEHGFMNRLHLHQLAMVTTGAGSMMLPLITTYGGLVAYVLLIGLVDGVYVVLLPFLTATLIGSEDTVVAWGFLVGVCSITYTLGPPCAGWLYDYTGSYNLSFHLTGVPLVIGALILFLIPWAQRTSRTTNLMTAARTYTDLAASLSKDDSSDDGLPFEMRQNSYVVINLTENQELDLDSVQLVQRRSHQTVSVHVPTGKRRRTRDDIPDSVIEAIRLLKTASRTSQNYFVHGSLPADSKFKESTDKHRPYMSYHEEPNFTLGGYQSDKHVHSKETSEDDASYSAYPRSPLGPGSSFTADSALSPGSLQSIPEFHEIKLHEATSSRLQFEGLDSSQPSGTPSAGTSPTGNS